MINYSRQLPLHRSTLKKVDVSEMRNEAKKYVAPRQDGHRKEACTETCVLDQDGQHAVLLIPKKLDTNEF